MADDHRAGQIRPLPVMRAAPVTPDRNHRRSYETGESSNSAKGSVQGVTPSTSRSNNAPADHVHNYESSPADAQLQSVEHTGRDGRLRRRNRHRSGGGFLLQDVVTGDGTRRRAKSIVQGKMKGTQSTPEQPQSSPSQNYGALRDSKSPAGDQASSPVAHGMNGRNSGSTDSRTKADEASLSPAGRGAPELDVDATQIVSMALNLSESRRIASRRDISRSNPPRLMSLPESASKTNLRQHFQQQRKTSRTESPRPGQGSSPRITSGGKLSSPLQPAFDGGQDGAFRFHFSASTLARAQKAKEHLELMAEYRRLLEGLPPLKRGHERNPAVSPPNSPRLSSTGRQVAVYRPYNPLQYIRNRKVRSRERKVIDGEQQGFGDVDCVRTWVDRVLQWNRGFSGNGVKPAFTMPHYPGIEDPESQPSPEPASKQALRVRRPRVDWFFDPCDMIADAYWLEQNHHKHLIEDRFWRRIFPPPPTAARPPSQQGEETPDDHALPSTTSAEAREAPDIKEPQPSHTDEAIPSGTRERAKEKFRDMRGFHHRHNSSFHGPQDFLRSRRDSFSDTSGSETELKDDLRRKGRRSRRGTITSDTNDLLQKQMMDIVAQEAREKELADVPETEAVGQPEPTKSSDPTPPKKARTAPIAAGAHIRKTSVADFSDPERQLSVSRSRVGSPVRYQRGRTSLEIPEDPRRPALGDTSISVPSSPKADDFGENPFSGQFSITASVASSRTGSPTRNPLSKVKRRLKAQSRDIGAELQSGGINEDTKLDTVLIEPPSPLGKLPSRLTGESNQSHRSTPSMRLREDQSAGIRGLFKAPRIDTVIRGGVSKLGEMIWKKDANDSSSSDSSSDESDCEDSRLQSKKTLPLSRPESKTLREDGPGSKHFIDSMPQFQSMGEYQAQQTAGLNPKPSATELSRPVSRQSARWEQLRPPRIDIRAASPASLGVPDNAGVSEASDSESYQNSVPDEVRAADRRLNSIIEASMLSGPGRSPSRQWSITDGNFFPERARLSKREIARMRALILSSGIKAMEIHRRAHETCKPLCQQNLEIAKRDPRGNIGGVEWDGIAKLAPDYNDIREQQVISCDIYPLASRTLGMAIQASGQRWQASADHFTSKTTPGLQKRIWEVRSRITDDLSEMARRVSDEADETNKQLALDQPLKIKHVIDVIDKLVRKRRRRFRWVRRGLWLGVEWVLVGIMWYVWFVVMILRIFIGVGKGVVNGVRWLLWI